MVGDFLDFIYYVVLHDIISGLVDKFIIGDEMEWVAHLAVEAEDVFHLDDVWCRNGSGKNSSSLQHVISFENTTLI